ncbi:MAG TPA: DUF4012 domain-containing protein [candidate division WWE3 bacterium]|uniref:DUF4012 domain-containing protein n=1 Tax=candidate division WWE3 bacterium TaxID=2053526 RepID=A0A7V5J0Z3_UNCKA|nr:DUF4012 domain-containing protein [candidate division WWE3 bacterium]
METYYEPKKKLPKISIKFPKIHIRWGLILKIFLGFIFLVLLLGGFLAFYFGKPALAIYDASKKLKDSSYGLKASLKTQDLEQIELNLKTFQKDYATFKDTYEENSPRFKKLPYIRDYEQDVDHVLNAGDYSIDLGFLMINTLKPYAKELGLAKGGEKLTNEQKIKRLTSVLPKISNKVEDISLLMSKIDSELSQIDASKYPEEFRGFPIRSQIVSLQTVSSELSEKFPRFQGLFEQLPKLLGVDEPKKYLVLMANSTELRMGGGFTTYAIVVEINSGIPKIVKSVDTYFIDVDHFSLDNRNVPYFLRDYLRVNRLYARDALSTSPDFVEGVDLFMNRYWNLHPGFGAAGLLPKVDGVIQVNTHLAESLLKVVGPVDVRGRSFLTDQGTYKGFSDTEFNSENIIYNLETIANSQLSEIQGRKDIINFLLESILDKVLNARSETILPLVQTSLEALGSKDIMIYDFDPEVQKVMEDLGYAGRVDVNTPANQDYLFVVHSNFGAGKRDWIVTRKTTKEVYQKNGKTYSKVSVEVNNPKAPEWWEPSWMYLYKDYLRVYVPNGSKLVDSSSSMGQEINARQFDAEEFNKDFFEFFFNVPEGKIHTITMEYELPDTIDYNNYKLLIQKQSGTHGDVYTIKKGDNVKRFTLGSDTLIQF